MTQSCSLCKKNRILQISHIFPKFIFNELKKCGSPIRKASEANIRRQDGDKAELLCKDCEEKFNISEKWFSENVFIPYLNNSNAKIIYNENLYYFAISLVWRLLVYKKKYYENCQFKDNIIDAEIEWRKYLLYKTKPKNYNKVHIILTDITENQTLPVENWNRYITRTIDSTLGYNSKICFMYVKFQKFIIIVEISGFKKNFLKNTKININKGIIKTPQIIQNSNIGEFIVQRAKDSTDLFKSKISKKQQDLIESKTMELGKDFLNSDLYRALKADYSNEINPKKFNLKLDDNFPENK